VIYPSSKSATINGEGERHHMIKQHMQFFLYFKRESENSISAWVVHLKEADIFISNLSSRIGGVKHHQEVNKLPHGRGTQK